MGPQLKVVERSRTATMLCAASGNPDPEITWFKDFLPVNTSNNNGRIKQLRSGDQRLSLSLSLARPLARPPTASDSHLCLHPEVFLSLFQRLLPPFSLFRTNKSLLQCFISIPSLVLLLLLSAAPPTPSYESTVFWFFFCGRPFSFCFISFCFLFFSQGLFF